MNDPTIKAFIEHIPVLVVALPLFTAPILAFALSGTAAQRWKCWLLTLLIISIVTVLSGFMLLQTIATDSYSYFLGNWTQPYGIEYAITPFSAFLMVILSAMAFITLPYGLVSNEKELTASKTSMFYAIFLLCFGGLAGMIMSNDLFNIYVFLEISSLATYALIAMGNDKKALKSAFNYLIIGTVGATLYLFGIALLYIQTGSLNLSDISAIISRGEMDKPLLAAFALMIIGVGVKSAIFPLGSWLVGAYAYANSFFSAFLASTSTKIGLFLLIRVIFLLFGGAVSFELLGVNEILATAACIAMIYGSIAAFFQEDVKRLLAFSSLSNIGYIIFGVAVLNEAGLIGGIFHFFAHALSKAGLFMFIGAAAIYVGGTKLKDLGGLGEKYPSMAAAFVILAAALVGFPLTAGFISKWYLLSGAVEFGGYVAALFVAALCISSVLAIAYMWKVIEAVYYGKPKKGKKLPAELPRNITQPIWICAALGILFGVVPGGMIEIITKIVGGLL